MGTQLLGAKWLRKLSATTGKTVVRGWAHGGYTHEFITEDHEHGLFDMKTGEVWWVPNEEVIHYTSCERWE